LPAGIPGQGAGKSSVNLILLEEILFESGCFRVNVLRGKLQYFVGGVAVVPAGFQRENDDYDDHRGDGDQRQAISQGSKPGPAGPRTINPVNWTSELFDVLGCASEIREKTGPAPFGGAGHKLTSVG
jgi:hypothetical protein